MPSNSPFALTVLLLFALLANIPLGFLRERTRRLSLRWFIYIHLSIPFIILLRQSMHFKWTVVPFTIGCAVLGQMIGSRIQRRSVR